MKSGDARAALIGFPSVGKVGVELKYTLWKHSVGRGIIRSIILKSPTLIRGSPHPLQGPPVFVLRSTLKGRTFTCAFITCIPSEGGYQPFIYG